MTLFEILSKDGKIENVELLGVIDGYTREPLHKNAPDGLLYARLHVGAVAFKGAIPLGVKVGLNGSMQVDEYVYVATRNANLTGKLVVAKQKYKGVNLKINYFNRKRFIGGFVWRLDGGSWQILETTLEESTGTFYNPVFKAVSDYFKKEGRIPNSPLKEVLNMQTGNEIELEQREFGYLPEMVAEDVLVEAKKELELLEKDFKKRVEGVGEKYGSILTVYQKALTHLTEDQLFELELSDDGFPKLSDYGKVFEQFVSTNVASTTSSNAEAFDGVVFNALSYLMREPYMFSLYFGVPAISVCDKITTMMFALGEKVAVDGRLALQFRTAYSQQQNTIVNLSSLRLRSPKAKQVLGTDFPSHLLDQVPQFYGFQALVYKGTNYGYISTDNLYKEAYIYSEIKKRAVFAYKEMDSKRVEEEIERLPFELEPLQEEVIRGANGGVVLISGCAGSGKTTIAQCIEGSLNSVVKYATPTGKASRRLSEVVSGQVRTIHSLFKLNIVPDGLLSPLQPKGELPFYADALIFDESAMINTSVAYRMLRVLEDAPNIKLIFMGDENQLPAIGNGAIFRDLTEKLKPTKLSVSKRFEEGSGVGKNCAIIVKGGTILEETMDFEMIEADFTSLHRKIINKFIQLANEKGLDNVQIATPYVTPKKDWSSTNLNPRIQEVLHPDESKSLGSTANIRLFYDDRVVHSGTNYPSKIHYQYDEEEKTFVSRGDVIGVFNGDVGKVRAVVHVNEVSLDMKLAKEEFPYAESDLKLDTTHFVVIEYNPDDYVLYPCRRRGDRLYSDEVIALELAYAMTIHKLQGSEYDSIIFPITKTDNPNFVGNEMVYTAISRAKSHVSVIGDVGQLQVALGTRNNPKIKTLIQSLK